MARQPIQSIELPGPVSPGRQQVEIQKPGPGERLNFNPNSGYRRPWVHGFYPGRADDRVGKDDPIVAQAREAALAAGVDISIVNQLDLDDLIVSPEFIGGTVGGISFRTPRVRVQQNTILDQSAEFEPSGIMGMITLEVSEFEARQPDSWVSAPIAAPVILRNVSFSFDSSAATPRLPRLMIPEIGWSVPIGQTTTPAGTSLAQGQHELMHWLLRGVASLRLDANIDPTTTDNIYGSATLSYEILRPKAR